MIEWDKNRFLAIEEINGYTSCKRGHDGGGNEVHLASRQHPLFLQLGLAIYF